MSDEKNDLALPVRSDLLEFCDKEEKKKYMMWKKHNLIKIRGDIPINLQIPNGARILVISNDQTYLTHGLHKYPAKFIPEYPRWAIRKFAPTPGNFILDPFCGSGTTNVEARLHKQYSYAIDIDPLARLITKVKTTTIDIQKIKETQGRILGRLHHPIKDEVDIPDFPNRDYWFKPQVCKELAFLRKVIEEEATEQNLKDFFLVCFSSIIRLVSNADPKLVLPKISKMMREKERKGRRIDVFSAFRKTLAKQVPRIIMFSKKCPKEEPYFTKIIGEDAREINLPNESIDLAITSPPYLNAHDYVRAHKLEMYWLGFLGDSNEKSKLEKRYIGTEKFSIHEYANLHFTGNDELDNIIERIYQKDRRRAYIVYRYFVDMQKHFEEIHRVLKSNSYYIMFVGDNVIRKVPVPTHIFLTQFAEKSGFELELNFASKLIKRFEIAKNRDIHGGLIENDWVLLLRKV